MARKLMIVIGLLVAVGVTLALRHRDRSGKASGDHTSQFAETPTSTGPSTRASAPLPILLELGSDSCIPCKMMAPILDALKTTYAGRLRVEFVDVFKQSEVAERYGVSQIPTQIFFDASGKELYRHLGFMPKEDILAKWRTLGIDLDKAPPRSNGK